MVNFKELRRTRLWPAIEALLVFAAFWLGSWLPGGAASVGASLALPAYHLSLLLQLAPKALLLLYLMARLDGLEAYGGLGKPAARDAYWAIVTAAGAFALVLAASALASLLPAPPENPMLAGAVRPSASPFILVPAILFSCIAVGYTEELYFRVYLLKRLGDAGLPPFWAAAVSVLLFASAHGLQGEVGPIMAALIGTWLCFRRFRGASLHELAWAHALYDSGVMIAVLYFAT